MTQNGFIFILIAVFFIESIAEARLFTVLRLAKPVTDAQLEKRRRRVLRVETHWNWLSWIVLFIILFTPQQYIYLTISIIVLLETLVVMELDNVWQRMKTKLP